MCYGALRECSTIAVPPERPTQVYWTMKDFRVYSTLSLSLSFARAGVSLFLSRSPGLPPSLPLSLLQHSQEGSAQVGPPARVRALGCKDRTDTVGLKEEPPVHRPQHPNTRTPNPPRRLGLTHPTGWLRLATARPEGLTVRHPPSTRNSLAKLPSEHQVALQQKTATLHQLGLQGNRQLRLCKVKLHTRRSGTDVPGSKTV